MFYVASKIGEQEYLAGENVLVSAGTAWNNPGSSPDGFDIGIPDADTLFVDSGGYQAVHRWGGTYPYEDYQLIEWSLNIGADYLAGMDLVCAPRHHVATPETDKTAADIAPIPDRIAQTIRMQRREAELLSEYNTDLTFVPIIQGYTVDQFRRCASELKLAGLGRPYMGIGTTATCHDPTITSRVLRACRDIFPKTTFHLFGASLTHWQETSLWGRFASSDTHAWARNVPDESRMPSTAADEEAALTQYKDRLTSLKSRISQTDSLSNDTDRDPNLPPLAGETCVCGTEIPVHGIDFEPGCRLCQQYHLAQFDRSLEERDAIATSTAYHDQYRKPPRTQTSVSDF